MRYYEELIERICRVIEEKLYVCVETTVSVEGYELILTAENYEGFTKTYKVHYCDLEQQDPRNNSCPVMMIAGNITASFMSEFKDTMYRPI